MHLLYKSLTAALALTGCASLIVSGELNLVFIMPGLAIIPGYYRYLRGLPPISRWLVAGLAVLEIFVLAFDAVFVSRDFLIAVAHMTIIFQALKSFDFREPWDPLQVYFMALLQLIITSELSLSMAVGSVFVVFLFVFMAVLVVSHFMKEGTLGKVSFVRPMVWICLAAFVFTAVFFITVPRVKGGIWGRRAATGIRTVGFSGDLDFSSFGDVLSDDTIVMRVSISGPKLPLYWRGLTLDKFDGIAWHDTMSSRIRLNRQDGKFYLRRDSAGSLDGLTRQEVIVEPLDTDVVFGLGEIVAIETQGWFAFRDISGSAFLTQKRDRRFSYTLYSSEEPSGELYYGRQYSSMPRYLQIPEGMDRAVSLAAEVTARVKTDREKAESIERYLQRNFRYSLSVTAPPDGVSPMEHFLFTSRTGYCQYFASAMAVMLRAVGVPSRIVTGYTGGEANPLADYVIVRQNNAHSWVEAMVDGRWTRFDPTPLVPPPPPSRIRFTLDSVRMWWYRYVIGFGATDQLTIIRLFGTPVLQTPEIGGLRISVRPVYVLAFVALSGAAFYLLWVRGLGLPRLSPESRAFVRMRDKVRRKGGDVSGSSTSRDVFNQAISRGMDGPSAREFIELYEEARFGGRRLTYEERGRLKALLKKL